MSDLQGKELAAAVGSSGPVRSAVDERPLVRFAKQPDPELALWVPEYPQDGDPVFAVVRVGTFRNHWIDTDPTKDMPAKLAEHLTRPSPAPPRTP